MASTPAEWLPILAKRMDDDMSRVKMLGQYSNGNAPLPEGGKNVRASWERFQKQARTNWGGLISEAVADRIVPNGITVGGASDSEEAAAAQLVWRNNQMDSVFKQWLRYGLDFGTSFFTLWAGDVPVITADSPETMVVAADPLQPWRVRAALRVWRDLDVEKDFAMVWCEGSRQKFSRDCYTQNSRRRLVLRIGGDWTPEAAPVDTAGPPPVVVYNNPGGQGEFEPHIDIINRINKGMLDRLTIAAMQAYRNRALKAAAGEKGLPRVDEDGNQIDWAKVFEPAPGALWELPPGIDIWESQATDIRPLLDASRDDIRQLASASRTPLPMLMPDTANQSAAGAIATESGYLAKCADRCAAAKIGGTAVLVAALKLMGFEASETVELTFEPVERVSLAEKMAAAAQAKTAGLPLKTIMRKYLAFSPEELAQADLDRADEALSAGIFTPNG